MALINYIEPMNIGSIFTGIGSIVVAIFLIYIIYRISRPIIGWIELLYNKETKYGIIEEYTLDKIAKDRGINLNEELIKRNVISKRKETFRNKIEEEMFEKMFPKEKGEK